MTIRMEPTEHSKPTESTASPTATPAGTLKDLLVGPLADLHDVVTAHLDERNVRELLGEELSRLQGEGTGRSLALLALLHDAVRVTQIAFGPQPERHSAALAFAVPFLRVAARTFAAKGLPQFRGYQELGPREAARFLREYAADDRPFGGANPETGWSGLQLCRNVALRSGEPAALDRYERLIGLLLTGLERHGVGAGDGSPTQQLREFLGDTVADVRDALPDRTAEAARERAELDSRSRDLDQRERAVAEREREVNGRERQVRERERAATERERQADERERIVSAREREVTERERAAATRERDIEAQARAHSEHEAAVRRLEAELKRDRTALAEPTEPMEPTEPRESNGASRDREPAVSLAAPSIPEPTPEPLPDRPLPHGLGSHASTEDIDPEERLFRAARIGDAAAAAEALADGAPVDACGATRSWLTPLLCASGAGHAEVVRLLLDHGADPGIGDADGHSALLLAVFGGHADAIDVLAGRSHTAIWDIYPTLLQILRDVNSPIESQRMSVRAVGWLGHEAARVVPSLLGLLESDSRALGREAALAIARIDGGAVTELALPYLDEIIDAQPTRSTPRDPQTAAQVLAARADLHAAIGRWDAARADYESALRLWPDSFTDWELRAAAAKAAGDIGPESALRSFAEGRLSHHAGDYRGAITHWERAAERDPACPWPAERLAWLLATCPDESVRDADRACEWAGRATATAAAPGWRLLRTQAAALARAGRLDDATVAVRRAIASAPPEEQDRLQELATHFQRGEAYTEAQRLV